MYLYGEPYTRNGMAMEMCIQMAHNIRIVDNIYMLQMETVKLLLD